ncbi:hypothetical protein [Streptomyces sp. PT12]|uniref:hypothetical protein n=1 Tax=Streptomyces sp. PT12 TaxID=1510197 RepID=UPI000DE33589|nr:hypothetical protein [Streptomyces sp. PT12]RBM15893.1 hypothetical protein DEH69_17765 [Streptomyces sp. PT12]
MPSPSPTQQRRLALYALALCALTIVAAVISFASGNWLGIVWVLMTGLSSNMAWYYHRRAKRDGATGRARPTA